MGSQDPIVQMTLKPHLLTDCDALTRRRTVQVEAAPDGKSPLLIDVASPQAQSGDKVTSPLKR
jgi:hypothetical protein